MKKTFEIYVHVDKDFMWELGEELGLIDEPFRMFRHTGCEIKLEGEVDMDTGLSTFTRVDGRRVDRRSET